MNLKIKQMKAFIITFSFLIISTLSCAQAPETSFRPEALENKMINIKNQSITFGEILNANKGKVLFIDIWASWCPDCIKALPNVKELRQNHPKVTFLFLSMDKNYDAWMKGIEKYEVIGEHFLTTDGMKGVFGKSIQLDWIPRYMIVDKTGKIVLYKSIDAADASLSKLLKTLE